MSLTGIGLLGMLAEHMGYAGLFGLGTVLSLVLLALFVPVGPAVRHQRGAPPGRGCGTPKQPHEEAT